MSDTAERWACDTSVAVAALDPNHEAHAPCRTAVLARRPVLVGRAAFEAYSVLTRLPVPLRLSAGQTASVLVAAFPSACWLSESDSAALSGWPRLDDPGASLRRASHLLRHDVPLIGIADYVPSNDDARSPTRVGRNNV